MDDWNDFGAGRQSNSNERRSSVPYDDHLQRQASQLSSSHLDDSTDGGEPRSVLFRAGVPDIAVDDLSALTAKPHNEFTRLVERRSSTYNPLPGDSGEMDDDSDFDDLGLTELRNTSSSYRFHRRSYTKLEVISSMQIQQIVHFFHIVIAVALSWTVFSVIVCNAMFSSSAPIPVLPALLSERQLESSQELSNTMRFSTHHYTPYSSVDRFPEWWEKRESFDEVDCSLRAIGVAVRLQEFYRVPPMDCEDVEHPCYKHWKAACEARPNPSVRTLKSTVRRGEVRRSEMRRSEVQLVPVRNLHRRHIPFQTRILVMDRWYAAVAHLILLLGGITLLILGTCFAIRLSRTGRSNISQEQLFVCALLFSTALYFNIPYAMIQLYFNTVGSDHESVLPKFIVQLTVPLKVLRELGLGPLFMFYIWANIHAYRILDPVEKLGLGFYLPKLALLGPYFVLKCMAFLNANLWISESPFVSAMVLVHTYRGFHVWRAERVMCLYVLGITLFELVYLAVIVMEAVKTVRVLKRAPYMKHRSKQIGFRFFIYLAGAYCITYYFLHVLLIVGRPKGEMLGSRFIAGIASSTIYQIHLVGPIMLTFGYVLVSAFVNLPYNSVGAIRGWIKGSELAPASSRWTFNTSDFSASASDTDSKYGAASNTSFSSSYPGLRSSPRDQQLPTFVVDKDYELMREIVEPITYRKRESDDALELKANCFTMQTHVILFNFAWYVYYYGTPKCENFNPTETVLPFKFSVAEAISEPATDTHALVIDADDRILVSFKGTTSMRNLKTSMKIYHESLVKVVPTNIDGKDELHRLRLVFGRSYEAAKIHKGFALAYASVAERVMTCIKRLIDQKPRPVFLTGHSLGGALATICSLDVWIKLRISRRQIFVSTFGSPRVGNEAFSRIYDSVIALHWRIVVDSDMVAKLPKGMFRHVGKKVLLTPHGQMFIDPSALELKLWSGSTAGLAYHRKASYLLAMRAWCVRHHKKTYTPAFWPFPVRDEDKQRFEYSGINEDDGSFSDSSLKANQLLAKKIVMRDTMVDSLDDQMNVNAEAVERWARLARRLLLRSKLEER